MDKTEQNNQDQIENKELSLEEQIKADLYDPMEGIGEEKEEVKAEVDAKDKQEEASPEEESTEPKAETESQEQEEKAQEKPEESKSDQEKDSSDAMRVRLAQERAKREKLEAEIAVEKDKNQRISARLKAQEERDEAVKKASKEHGFEEDIANIPEPQVQQPSTEAVYKNSAMSLANKIDATLDQAALKDFNEKVAPLRSSGQISDDMLLVSNQVPGGEKLIIEAVKNPLIMTNLQTAILQGQMANQTQPGSGNAQAMIAFQGILNAINAVPISQPKKAIKEVPEQMEEQRDSGGISPMAQRIAEKTNDKSFLSNAESATRRNFGDMASY